MEDPAGTYAAIAKSFRLPPCSGLEAAGAFRASSRHLGNRACLTRLTRPGSAGKPPCRIAGSLERLA